MRANIGGPPKYRAQDLGFHRRLPFRRFVFRLRQFGDVGAGVLQGNEPAAMDAEKEREIIRLWSRLRLLEKEGRQTMAVRRQIEKALAERETHAA